MNSKREIELVVISDTHLGSYGSRAEELFNYLNSINPKKIVLNGDIIDFWQFKKRNWDKYHTKAIKKLVEFISQGNSHHTTATKNILKNSFCYR